MQLEFQWNGPLKDVVYPGGADLRQNWFYFVGDNGKRYKVTIEETPTT